MADVERLEHLVARLRDSFITLDPITRAEAIQVLLVLIVVFLKQIPAKSLPPSGQAILELIPMFADEIDAAVSRESGSESVH